MINLAWSCQRKKDPCELEYIMNRTDRNPGQLRVTVEWSGFGDLYITVMMISIIIFH